MKRTILFLILISACGISYAQENPLKQKLLTYSSGRSLLNRIRHNETLRHADSLGIPIRVESDNSIIELSFFRNGFPRFTGTDNINAAATTSTAVVWPGGSAGLNLSGNGITLGIWDGGAVLSGHQEFGGRVSVTDGTTSLSSHATHVAGTMISAGIDPLAKGMSFQADLLSHDWNNDEAEMAEAAANGLQVSNHSYGYLTGWDYNYRLDGKWVWFGDTTFSRTSDYGFGAYEITSRDWDTLAWLAPEYLIVKSSGNDRFEGPATQPVAHWVWNGGDWALSSTVRDRDGGADGYDCIPWQGVAKNILTIGAVYDIPAGYQTPSDVILASFSDTGPADDGRIKPDIVANGTSLYSCTSTSTTAYATMTGTSMASPNTSGSLGLLEQHHRDLSGSSPIRSATLKGLVIHTASEAGTSDGPDYKFGWGLLNIQKSALLMSEDAAYGFNFNLRELSLGEGDTISIPVYTTGAEPLVATICWTDPPSDTFTEFVNDRTPVLVNDLDLRLITDGEITHYPWILDVENPSDPATRGDDVVDNVEKVEAGTPPAQHTCRIQITHKNTLFNEMQDFSLIISGICPAPSATEWNGAVSSDWHTSSNWSNGIPGAETDVTINNVSGNIPVISTTAWCHTLSIGSEGALTVEDSVLLHVLGDMLLQSDASNTGSYLGPNPQVNGLQRIGRYIGGFSDDYDGWHLLASPVRTQPISDFHTPGSGNDFYKWDEGSGLWINRTAEGGTLNPAFDTGFVAGNGYLVANSASEVMYFSGFFNDADIAVLGLTRSDNGGYDGWNLLGNPYPSPIVWNDGFNWNVPVEFAAVAKVWDEQGAAYLDRSPGSVIPSANGFMLQLLSGSNASLTIPAAARAQNANTWFKSADPHLTLLACDTDQTTAQQTVIVFRNDATEGYDPSLDSHFLPGFAPEFYSVAENEKLSTNSLPEIPYGKRIQLGFLKNEAERFSIGVYENTLPVESAVYLIDYKTGNIYNLSEKSAFEFTSFNGDDPERFSLFIGDQNHSDPEADETLIITSVNGSVCIAGLPDQQLEIALLNAFGQTEWLTESKGKNMVSLGGGRIAPGVYIVYITGGTRIRNQKIILN